MHRFNPPLRRAARPLAVALAAGACALAPASAMGGSGGTGTSDGAGTNCVSGSTAKLQDGKAIPPCNAPGRVVRGIRAANEIAKGKGYCWGGGHASFRDNCYDCSGAVSYMLHGARLLDSPMASSGLMSWGSRGKGNWITVFAHSGHAYAKVAGLRWDTSMTRGEGPGWSSQNRSSSGFKVRHKGSL